MSSSYARRARRAADVRLQTDDAGLVLVERLDAGKEAASVERASCARLELLDGARIVGIVHTLDALDVGLARELGAHGCLEADEGARAGVQCGVLAVVVTTGEQAAHLCLKDGCPARDDAILVGAALALGLSRRSGSGPGLLLLAAKDLGLDAMGKAHTSDKGARGGLERQDRVEVLSELAVDAFLLGLGLWFGLDVHLLCEGLADGAKGGHGDARGVEALLGLLELVVCEFELADEVADLERPALASEDVAEGVDAVDDLGEVFLFVEVGELEVEKVREADFVDEAEKVVDVVRVAVLELGVDKDARDAVGLKVLCELGEEDAVAHFVFHLDDVAELFADVEFHPFLGLAAVAEVLVGLEEVALGVHPLARAGEGQGGGGGRGAAERHGAGPVCAREADATVEAGDVFCAGGDAGQDDFALLVLALHAAGASGFVPVFVDGGLEVERVERVCEWRGCGVDAVGALSPCAADGHAGVSVLVAEGREVVGLLGKVLDHLECADAGALEVLDALRGGAERGRGRRERRCRWRRARPGSRSCLEWAWRAS
ncbi:hypothetical protein L1887_55240 [Cichorium endivia]|nr:hypothetical protein L1887_55240 [Cichorium endivia]